MKKIFYLLYVLILVSCSPPAESAIQTAIAETEGAKISDFAIQTAIAETQSAEVKLDAQSTPTVDNSEPSMGCSLTSPVKNEWQTVLCDTFDESGDWWTGLDASTGIEISISDGKYYIDHTSKNAQGFLSGWYTAMQIAAAQDYVISLTGEMTSKYKQCTWGITVRGDYSDGYTFSIDNQGNYWLTAEGSSNKYIGNVEYGSNSAIKWDSSNTITALVEDDVITFYVNGKPVVSYEADNSSSPEISWSIWGAEGVTALYEFDDLLIKVK